MGKFQTIWQNRSQILEGLKNNMFKSEHVEEIAAQRGAICFSCEHIDLTGDQCLVSGTQPCCGKCGCSLKLKLRSLSSSCGDESNPRWKAVVDHETEMQIKERIGYKDPEE